MLLCFYKVVVSYGPPVLGASYGPPVVGVSYGPPVLGRRGRGCGMLVFQVLHKAVYIKTSKEFARHYKPVRTAARRRFVSLLSRSRLPPQVKQESKMDFQPQTSAMQSLTTKKSLRNSSRGANRGEGVQRTPMYICIECSRRSL